MQLSKWWECEATDAQKLLSQREKVAKCNFKSKAQLHEKCFFLMKWNVFCNGRRQIFKCLSFFAEKVILELNCTNHFFRASKNTNSVFSANSKLRRRMARQDAQTILYLDEKKLLNSNLKSKAQCTWKIFLSNEMKCFLQCRRQIFMMFEAFLQKKVILKSLNCKQNHFFRAS